MDRALDYAKYLINRGYDSHPNTYYGNMKLNELLVFTDLFNLAENHKPLFEDKVLAFKNGCVIEDVWQKYKKNYDALKEESEREKDRDFSAADKEILELTTAVFGNLTVGELSELNHQLFFWKNAVRNGKEHNRTYAEVSVSDIEKEINKIKAVISAYRETQKTDEQTEVIHGVTFYYNSDELQITDHVIEQLEPIAADAKDGDCFSVYLDDGRLVAY